MFRITGAYQNDEQLRSAYLANTKSVYFSWLMFYFAEKIAAWNAAVFHQI